ncbi:membrane protein [Rhizocola hellebori]|uniref:Membrane protein n=1 Tax=Rhizocola hellebori TaxID=1392758 RepID=A0A8J3Q5R0_9ACTN|nr:peptidase C39 family protein [Rhizocola hellebori]GIH04533.1 membrane protein [Rhizocola hellebori]
MPKREIILFRWSSADFAGRFIAAQASPVPGYVATVWTSEPMRPGFGATELIPSWTASTPGGSFLRVELCGVNEAGRATKWYRLGDWAAEETSFTRTSVSGQDDEDASVSADILVAAQGRALHSVQARVTMLCPQGSVDEPVLHTLHLLVSAVPRECEPSAPLAAQGKLLAVPGFSQLIHEGGEGWCSAASTAMVLSYWGVGPVPLSNPDSVVPYTAKKIFDQGFGGCGNWPFNTAYAGGFGVRSFVTRLRSLNEAELFIAAGIPLVVSASYGRGEVPGLDYETDGHLTVLVGFTEQGDPVLNDPNSASNAEVRKAVGRAEWEAAWLRSSRGVVYVICPESVNLPPSPIQANW